MRDKIIVIISAFVILLSLVMALSEEFTDNTALADDSDSSKIYETVEDLPQQVEEESPWLIELDLYNQIVTIYAKDDNGEYFLVINQFPCSAGMKARQTESKTPYMFRELYVGVGQDEKNSYMRLRDWGEWGWVEYITNIYDKFLFHSILYEDKSCTTDIHDAYSVITFPASHGCVRLLSQDVKWIYDYTEQGILCNVTKNEANPELTQLYQPPPERSNGAAATNPPNPYVRETMPPDIPWDTLNDPPKDYSPGNFG